MRRREVQNEPNNRPAPFRPTGFYYDRSDAAGNLGWATGRVAERWVPAFAGATTWGIAARTAIFKIGMPAAHADGSVSAGEESKRKKRISSTSTRKVETGCQEAETPR